MPFMWTWLSKSVRHLARIWLQDHLKRLCLVLQETANLSSKILHFAFPLSMNKSSCCSASLLEIGNIDFLILHVTIFVQQYFIIILIYHFLIWYGASLHVFVSHLYIFLGEGPELLFCPFLIGLLFFYCWVLQFLCIYWIQSSVKYIFGKYVLSVCGLTFYFLSVFHNICNVKDFNVIFNYI